MRREQTFLLCPLRYLGGRNLDSLLPGALPRLGLLWRMIFRRMNNAGKLWMQLTVCVNGWVFLIKLALGIFRWTGPIEP